MQNYMKTIISALQTWTSGKIKDSTADWNQNDSSASNYVKNRTHWEDEPTDVILLPETILDFSAAGSSGGKWGVIDFEIKKGETYTVTWDGQAYKCIAQWAGYDGSENLGDSSLIGGSKGNGEPFWIGSYSGMMIMASEAGIHTISISIQQSVVHKLDEKYLPEYINDSLNELADMVWDAQNNAYDAKNTADNKMDKNNPVGTGSFSMNRKVGTTIGSYSHAEGSSTTASAHTSHAEGLSTTASAQASHAEGQITTASGEYSHAEGFKTTASGIASHAEGNSTNVKPTTILASNTNDQILASWDTTKFSWAKGKAAHVEGRDNLALGDYSHAEGWLTIASSYAAHAEGNYTTASNTFSHAEGDYTIASGIDSHAEGRRTTASGMYSHSEGSETIASGYISHSEGDSTVASGSRSHAEGDSTVASGSYSHAEGNSTVASGENQHTQGKYNIEDTSSTYAHIVGNGTSDTSRSNAHTLDWDGNAWYQGEIYVGGTSQDDATARLLKTSETATDDDILDTLSEMSYIDPISASDGSIYTNRNGEIYIL